MILVPMVLLVLGSIFAAFASLALGGGRWGFRLVPEEGSEGPFRSGLRHRKVRVDTPWTVRFAVVSAFVWASLTLVLFVPAGALLIMLALGVTFAHNSLAAILLFGAIALVFSGVVLSLQLYRSGWSLGAADTDAVEQCRAAAEHCRVHHVCVMVIYGVLCVPLSMLERQMLDWRAFYLLGFVAVPCLVGAGVGAMLEHAARRLTLVRDQPEPGALR